MSFIYKFVSALFVVLAYFSAPWDLPITDPQWNRTIFTLVIAFLVALSSIASAIERSHDDEDDDYEDDEEDVEEDSGVPVKV